MPRDDAQRLDDMLEASDKVMSKVHGLTFEQFIDDENLHLAVTLLIQIVGEAASRVTTSTRQCYEDIPWSQIIGMRNILVHDYGGIDYRIVWQVATNNLPKLVDQLRDRDQLKKR